MRYRPSKDFVVFCTASVFVAGVFFALPQLVVSGIDQPAVLTPFPVSVDPRAKTIKESVSFFDYQSPVAAALEGVRGGLAAVAVSIVDQPVYRALVGSVAPVSVQIYAGMRKEQVATAFATALGWTPEQRQAFQSGADRASNIPVEGTLYPSVYVVPKGTTPAEAYALVRSRFDERILGRYATSTHAIVPLNDALTMASSIERETSDHAEMRVIAGIMWNRIFTNMKLQVDSTLQYARGTSKNGWWPVVRSRDKYILSPYNTYQSVGLPPTSLNLG